MSNVQAVSVQEVMIQGASGPCASLKREGLDGFSVLELRVYKLGVSNVQVVSLQEMMIQGAWGRAPASRGRAWMGLGL